MNATMLHDDATGFHLVHGRRTYRPIAPTTFDEVEEVRIASVVPYSDDPALYIVVRSADGQVVEDWKSIDAGGTSDS